MGEPLFLLESVSKVYQERGAQPTPVLNEISLSISAGEYVSITGPSGSGKSTLMHILGLLHAPSSGRYLFDGQDVGSLKRDETDRLRNRKIGFVFQDFALIQNQSVVHNVCLPLIYAEVPRRERRALAVKVLERLGIGHRSDYDIRLLSGGEKQRVAVARALVSEPAVILADEPTGNLDQKTGQQLIEIFDSLNDQGITVVLVTHDAGVARHCPINFHLADGRVVEVGRGAN